MAGRRLSRGARFACGMFFAGVFSPWEDCERVLAEGLMWSDVRPAGCRSTGFSVPFPGKKQRWRYLYNGFASVAFAAADALFLTAGARGAIVRPDGKDGERVSAFSAKADHLGRSRQTISNLGVPAFGTGKKEDNNIHAPVISSLIPAAFFIRISHLVQFRLSHACVPERISEKPENLPPA